MKPDVLVLGSLPPATMDELNRRFTIYHFDSRPPPSPEVIGRDITARVRGLATEVNRGANRQLIEGLPKLEIISCFGVGLDLIRRVLKEKRKAGQVHCVARGRNSLWNKTDKWKLGTT